MVGNSSISSDPFVMIGNEKNDPKTLTIEGSPIEGTLIANPHPSSVLLMDYLGAILVRLDKGEG